MRGEARSLREGHRLPLLERLGRVARWLLVGGVALLQGHLRELGGFRRHLVEDLRGSGPDAAGHRALTWYAEQV